MSKLTKPLVVFRYPVPSDCSVPDEIARSVFRSMCMKQYGTPYHIIFYPTKSHRESFKILFEAGLIAQHFDPRNDKPDGFILVWNEEENKRALAEYEEKLRAQYERRF